MTKPTRQHIIDCGHGFVQQFWCAPTYSDLSILYGIRQKHVLEYFDSKEDFEKQIGNPPSRAEQSKKVWQRAREVMSCADCGKDDNIEFHHPEPENKEEMVSMMWQRGYYPPEVYEEIQKCEPICKGCHNKRHNKLEKAREAKQSQ